MRTSGRDPVNLYRLPFPHPGPNAWLQSPDAIHSADSIQPPDAQTLDPPAPCLVISPMITYSVFRLAARRTVLWVDSAAGMRAGERKTGWTKPLPPSPGLWALNAPGRLFVGHRGIPGGGLEAFAVPTRLSSGEHSLDLTIWPSGWNADGALGASVPAPA